MTFRAFGRSCLAFGATLVLLGCSTSSPDVRAADPSPTQPPATAPVERSEPVLGREAREAATVVEGFFDGANRDVAAKAAMIEDPSLEPVLSALHASDLALDTMTVAVVDVEVPVDVCPTEPGTPCALVRYELSFDAAEGPDRPYRFAAYVVQRDGAWKLSRSSFCEVAAFAGQPCPS